MLIAERKVSFCGCCYQVMTCVLLQFKRLMNKLDPFEGEDEASDQETAAAAVVAPPSPNQLLPPPPPNPAPSQPLPPPPDPVLQTPLPTTRRQRSQSRASSTGSSSTSSSRLLRKPGRTRPDTPSVGESKHKRRRKRVGNLVWCMYRVWL